MHNPSRIPIGVYEKAFPDELSWPERLEWTARAGYDFLDISIDESDARLARLDYAPSERAALREAVGQSGIPIQVLGLSCHRRFPLGSASPETRARGLDILRRAVDWAADIGTKIIQVMGYDVFYEANDAGTAARYLEGIVQGAHWAGSAGMMLGLENVDVQFVDNVEKALHFVREIDSPWLQVFPDIGNMAAAGYDPIQQLPLAKGRIVAVHVKDVRPGQVRGVPMGQGIVDFEKVFPVLAGLGFWGPVTVEMWAHLHPVGEPFENAVNARHFVDQFISSAWKYDGAGND